MYAQINFNKQNRWTGNVRCTGNSIIFEWGIYSLMDRRRSLDLGRQEIDKMESYKIFTTVLHKRLNHNQHRLVRKYGNLSISFRDLMEQQLDFCSFQFPFFAND